MFLNLFVAIPPTAEKNWAVEAWILGPKNLCFSTRKSLFFTLSTKFILSVKILAILFRGVNLSCKCNKIDLYKIQKILVLKTHDIKYSRILQQIKKHIKFPLKNLCFWDNRYAPSLIWLIIFNSKNRICFFFHRRA